MRNPKKKGGAKGKPGGSGPGLMAVDATGRAAAAAAAAATDGTPTVGTCGGGAFV